ncbi:MAG: ParB N-terminal domain-containing protein [Nitrospinota bacterium]
MPAIEELNLEAIDEADRTFCLSVGGSLGALERSITAIGQTSPVHVRPLDGVRFQLVTGFRRVGVLRRLSRPRAVAAVHSLEELPDTAAARLAVVDNLGVRAYNLVEQARAVELLLGVGGLRDAEVVREVLPALGLQAHGQVLQRLRRLLELEEPFLEVIAREGWPARAVLPLCAWRPEARRAFFEVVRALRPGANKLSELAGWLEEIALREDQPISSVIADLELHTHATNEAIPTHERLKGVRNAVRNARYPTLTEMERRAGELTSKLALGPAVTVRPPEGFEGEAYEARFTFGSPEDLKAIGSLLSEAAADPAAAELRRLLIEGLSEDEEGGEP